MQKHQVRCMRAFPCRESDTTQTLAEKLRNSEQTNSAAFLKMSLPNQCEHQHQRTAGRDGTDPQRERERERERRGQAGCAPFGIDPCLWSSIKAMLFRFCACLQSICGRGSFLHHWRLLLWCAPCARHVLHSSWPLIVHTTSVFIPRFFPPSQLPCHTQHLSSGSKHLAFSTPAMDTTRNVLSLKEIWVPIVSLPTQICHPPFSPTAAAAERPELVTQPRQASATHQRAAEGIAGARLEQGHPAAGSRWQVPRFPR